MIASTGILVEANTRRFVVDEKKEMYYRAEVQNRVYKREVVEVRTEDALNERERGLKTPLKVLFCCSILLLFLIQTGGCQIILSVNCAGTNLIYFLCPISN